LAKTKQELRTAQEVQPVLPIVE